MPPSYGCLEYWNDRFGREEKFEWLLPTSRTLNLVSDQLTHLSNGKNSKLLHIGCGNSDLSHHLAPLLDEGGSVTNVDFSRTVIDAARKEFETGRKFGTGNNAKTTWIAADLLSFQDLQTSNLISGPAGLDGDMEGSGFDLVVDKSTSDSIACGDDIFVTLPHPIQRLTAGPKPYETLNVQHKKARVHPLQLLALHLALLARGAGSRWLCISYSPDRFGFLEGGNNGKSLEMTATHFANPRTLWQIQDKWPVDLCPPEGAGKRSKDNVHRPPEQCWVHVLVRTDVEVRWR